MLVDTVYVGARFLSGLDFRPVDALAVHHGRIVAMGDEARQMRSRRRMDLGGATVVPGFHDAHNHLAWFGMTLDELPLGEQHVQSVDDVYAAVAARAAELAPGSWIIGSGYDQNKLRGGHPTAEALDRAAPRHRVWLKHTSGHMCVVNSAVLAELDLDDVPEGGDVVRDAAGRPTGLLREQAQLLLQPLVYPVPVDRVARAIERGSRALLEQGVTSVQEAGIGGGWIGRTPIELAAYQHARAANLLHVRVTLMVAADAMHALDSAEDDSIRFGLDLGMHTGFGDDHLRIGAMKIFADGSLVGHTAAMCDDYLGEDERGYFQRAPEELRDTIGLAHRAGWQVATHAIGDRAIGEVLDIYDEVLTADPRPDHRHRIEHCGIARPEHVERIARLGVIPVPQGRFVYELGDGMIAAIGSERAEWCYRQKSFLDAGVEVPASSDRPVVDGHPLRGLRALIERRTSGGVELAPAEGLSPTEALRAYTYGSAFAGFAENRVGQLAPGYLADFAVLSADPLHAAEIDEIAVLATVVGGETVYDAAGLC
ncbi:MAG TPA: amidohydrolase [Solirubrobacteraceae bacterium]|nr:amidohydrolase [Solirubrobacteraceae bacterium]